MPTKSLVFSLLLVGGIAFADPDSDTLLDRTKKMEVRQAALVALVKKDLPKATKTLVAALELEAPDSGEQYSDAETLLMTYFDAFLEAYPEDLLSDSAIDNVLSLLNTRPMGFIQAYTYLDDRLFGYDGIFNGSKLYGDKIREVSESQLEAFKVKLFLKAIKTRPLPQLDFLLGTSQTFGINWDFGSSPDLPYGTSEASYLSGVLEIYSVFLSDPKFIGKPNKDESFSFWHAQSGMDNGVEKLMLDSSPSLRVSLPEWQKLLTSAKTAFEEELPKDPKARLQARLDASTLILFTGLGETEAFPYWARYCRKLHAETKVWGRTLARLSRRNPVRFAVWFKNLVGEDVVLATEAIRTLFSKDGDARSAGSRLFGNIIQGLERQSRGGPIQIVGADPALPPNVDVKESGPRAVLEAAREGALDILALHLSKQRESREQRAAFQKKPPRTGDDFPLYSNEYFAFALLQAVDSKAADEVERVLRDHYRLNADGYAHWDREVSFDKFIAEGARIKTLLDGMRYEEKNKPENELLAETGVALDIRGRLMEMRQLIGNACLRSMLNK